MADSIDNVVKGIVSYVHSLIVAILIGVGGMVTFRPLRAAIKTHTLFVSRPDFNLSGRSLLLFASTLFPISLDVNDSGHWQFWAVLIKGDEHVFKQILLVAAGTCIGLECCVGFITRTPWAGRFRRRVFRARAAAQRAEILRYMISFFMIACSVLIFSVLSLVPGDGMYDVVLKFAFALLLAICMLIYLMANLVVIYPTLSQVNVKAYARWSRGRIALAGLQLLAGVLPATAVMIFSYYQMLALGLLSPEFK